MSPPHDVMHIRQAVATDVPAIREVVHSAYAMYVPRIGREPAPMSANYAELVAAGEIWVGLEDSRVTGVLVIRPTEGELLLENVAVVPARQGRGHGRALISFAEGRAWELGLEAVVLYTNESMAENLALYPGLGYVETERGEEDGYRRVFFRKSVLPEDAFSPAALAIERGSARE